MVELTDCPFCGKKTISVVEIPSVLQIKTSRGSGQNSKMQFRTAAKTNVLSGCSECGKTKTEVQNKLEGKASDDEMIGKCVWCGKPCAANRAECGECGG